MDKVVIIIISHKSKLSNNEQLSLKQCYKVLSKYPIKIICPKGLDVSLYKEILPDPQFDFIDPIWQSSYANFNRLKIDPFLYKRYKNYQFILFYEPDAWVFQDELDDWSQKGYDYIGAPWFENYSSNSPAFQKLAGNGGFSLRKVDSILRVLKELKTFKYFLTPKEMIVNEFKDSTLLKFCCKLPKIIIKSFGFRNTISYYTSIYESNEDAYWVNIVPKYFPYFKVAKYNEAIPFAFECQPKKLFELNNGKLPFGCHAWEKYEYDTFWKEFIH
jgi:hypothetical protein